MSVLRSDVMRKDLPIRNCPHYKDVVVHVLVRIVPAFVVQLAGVHVRGVVLLGEPDREWLLAYVAQGAV